jgi:hypothetical protein
MAQTDLPVALGVDEVLVGLVAGLHVWGSKLKWFLEFPALGTFDVVNKQTRALNFFGARVDLLPSLFYELSKRAFERDLPRPETEEEEEEASSYSQVSEEDEEARAAEDRQLNAVLHGLCRTFSESGPSKVDLPLQVVEELTKRVWCGDVGAVLTLAKLLGRRKEHVRTLKENCSDVERNCSDAGRDVDCIRETRIDDAAESKEKHWPYDCKYEGSTSASSATRDHPWLLSLQPQLGRALAFFVDHGVAGEGLGRLAFPKTIPVICPFLDSPDFALAASSIAARYRELHAEAYLYDPDGEKREIRLREQRLLRGPDSGRPLDVEALFAAVLSLLPPPLDHAEGFAKAEAVLGWRPRCIMWDVGALLYVAGNGITEPLRQVPAWELLEANALDAATHVVCVRKLWREFWEDSHGSPLQWFTDIVDDC